ncbi:protein-methionine-sulfoxide reductase heme-binding subunit MsrQ [Acetobacter sp. DsW_063]|uniref:protein-methionine-sulfoxide reductase heme-binding subunit MsrQ n=1 Tax=Acetobacter sp. DsW_063 TaxID=1514894 RepID=UPI000A3A3445|nr:protein-methionine-sulfoxide reductase heme-binding subunit MsrQ [Acetobacter sp. DsW_063]
MSPWPVRGGPSSSLKRWLKSPAARWTLYFVALCPAAWWFWLGAHNRLGADPVRAFEEFLGLWAYRFLLASLLITPLRIAFSINLIVYRRVLGLLCFSYAAMHVLAYLALDLRFDFRIFGDDITKRPFLVFGMLTLLCLSPLALTSTNGAIRRLGRNWKKLHRLAYVALVTASIHFLMAFKTWHADAALFVAFGMFLLIFRGVRSFQNPKRRRVA